MNRSLFFHWQSFSKKKNKNIILNFGPQHPAAHGVLRLILELRSEVIERCDIHIGLLHRGTELLAETKYYDQTIPYFDRLDYVSMLTQEHAYCLAIESLLNFKNTSTYCNFLRILFDELTRLLNHLLAIACHALDVGGMSSIFWAFEEREQIMEFYERLSGARMHAAFHRPHPQHLRILNSNFITDIAFFVSNCFVTLNKIHNTLTYNKIWKQRLINIGSFSFKECQAWNLSGVLARSTGIKRDVRLVKKESYSNYNLLTFNSYLGLNGDTYDRYLIRMLEMGESLNIITQVLKKLNKINKPFIGTSNTWKTLILKNKKNKIANYTSMEDLIYHFLYWHSGYRVQKNISLSNIESPKGEFGVTLFSDNSSKPTRCKIKSPSYFNLQFLPKLIKGGYLADLVTLIGTIDIVFGEIDR